MPNLSILFWLRASAVNKSGKAPLLVRITIDGVKVDFSSGMTVDVKLWNVDKKQVSGKSPEAERINKYILSSEVKLNSIYDKLVDQEIDVSPEIIKNIFTGKTKEKITLISSITEHNQSFERKIEKEGKLSEDTLDMFETLKDKVKSFLATKNRKDVFITEINHAFIEDFQTWLLQEGHYKKGGLSSDTTVGFLKKLSKITTNLFKRGFIKTDPFLDIDLSWSKSTTEGVSESDINKLLDLKLDKPYLQVALDRAIIGSYTGMAHQDLSSVKKSDLVISIDGSKWIKIKRKKTGEVCNIPVLPPVEYLIEKYKDMPGDYMFPDLNINTCNNHLKKISEIAGLSIVLSTHKLRHGFSQMSFDAGMDIEALASILGHANSSVTRSIYARSSMKLVTIEAQKFKEKKFPALKIVETKKIG